MRLKILFLTVLAIVTLMMQASARAQYGWMPAAGYQSPNAASGYGAYPYQAYQAQQSSPYGYYVPVLVGNSGQVQPTNYALRVSDQEEVGLPAVSECTADCGCDSCTARIGRGCRRNCSCLRCRHDRLFRRSFGGIEYLIWYNKGSNLPPLVTSNSGGIPPQGDAGVLGRPLTSILFGNDVIDDEKQSGMRVMFGWWLDDACNLAVSARLYALEGGVVNFAAASAGNPVLGRPFFNSDPTVNDQDALLVAFPGLTSGTIDIQAANDVMGAEIMGRSLLDACDRYRLDLVGGYQFARIDSDLVMVSQHSTGGADFTFADLFEMDNQFHGGFGGLYGETYRGMFTFSALGKIGLGNMRQVANIQGFNTVTAGGSVTTPGGLYTQPTNIGTYRQDVLVWSPEANFRVSCAVTERLSVSIGYTFLYFTSVAFAGDQVDTNINGTQLNGGAVVGPARPTFAFRDTDFWIQTIDFGVSYEY